jgi:antibiotic biosynthesis monooxygenase (ABM) superfamily enzyme
VTPGETGPVTSTVTRRVKPGHAAAYETFLEDIVALASGFDGYLGTEIFRPAEPELGGEYRIVYRFTDASRLRAWLDAPAHTQLLAEADPHAAGPTRTHIRTGLETWFTLPAAPGVPPPPPWKMAVLTWLSLFPLISLIAFTLGRRLADIALVPRTAITTALTVALMTWVVMPRVTRLLRRWLFPVTEAEPDPD